MAQKDKVKELVGRSLDSYHTKSLQQIDRIEKKNKEQNHKINILTNELDNDYLTKTEEGSVVSLEHSKEGMVYMDGLEGNTLVNYCTDGSKELTLNDEIDTEGINVTLNNTIDNGIVDISLEGNTMVNVCDQKEPVAITKSYTVENTNHIPLQGEYDGKCRPVVHGNTMVNYCTDGAKELTLNGDINAEGTNVTLTDTIDNSKVDVVCEGNTLVNLLPNKELKITCNNDWDNFYAIGRPNVTSNITFGNTIQDVKPNTTYTLIYNVVTRPTSNHYLINNANASTVFDTYVRVYSDTPLGINKVVLTTLPDLTGKTVVLRQQNGTGRGEVHIKDYMLLEGDYTNKPIPSHFEGMKSVGELEDNKIEILSQNKNLVDGLEVGGLNPTNGENNENNGTFTIRNKGYIKVEPNTTYTLSIEDNNTFEGMVFHLYDKNKKHLLYNPSSKFTLTTPNDAHYLRFRSFNADDTKVSVNLKIQLEKGSSKTSYVPYSLNKKEISLNEPLRGLPNGVKDRFVKTGGKWYIERNCGEKIFNGDISEQWSTFSQSANVDVQGFSINVTPKALGKDTQYEQPSTLCDKFKVAHAHENTEHCYFYANEQSIFGLVINKTKASDIETLRTWLQNNNVKVVYVLASPIYEEITDVELITYLDTTHISNNSTIPCNMTVKNTRYNAIIKPSTQYTVAFDSNTGGEVGINLGGSKVTTNNNVTTIITPSTLTNNNLELYGKGVTVSNAMIFEGDLTQTPNLIPNEYVEGLKSSFEDNLVTQEMVDSGEESAENLGKYKVEYKVTGKNKFNINNVGILNGVTNYSIDNNSISIPFTQFYQDVRYFIPVKRGATYYISYSERTDATILLYKNKVPYGHDTDCYISNVNNSNEPIKIVVDNYDMITLRISSETRDSGIMVVSNIMVRESTSDLYEPYKESTKTFYLNSPLLEGDTIEDINGKATHVKRYGKVVLDGSSDENWRRQPELDTDTIERYWINQINNGKLLNIKPNTTSYNDKFISGVIDGTCLYTHNEVARIDLKRLKTDTRWTDLTSLKQWLQANPTTVVYELASPVYEPISTETILCDSYVNGHLDFDTNVPIEKVDFKYIDLYTKYSVPSTKYIIQFESDSVGKLDMLHYAGTTLRDLGVIKGLNTFSITSDSSSTGSNAYFSMRGIGFNASNISVVATEREFNYFEGMKSVGECEDNKIEILSQSNLADISTSGDNANFNIANLKAGKTYTIKSKRDNNSIQYNLFLVDPKDVYITKQQLVMGASKDCYTFTTTKDGVLRFNGYSNPLNVSEIMLVEGVYTDSTMPNFKPYSMNKKEISLNEPLRALPNGVKDRFVKQGGKWYVERNYGELLLDSNENWSLNQDLGDVIQFTRHGGGSYGGGQSSVLSDRFITLSGHISKEGVWIYNNNTIVIHILKTRLATQDLNGFKQWLQNNPTKVVYQLSTPIYEPLEIEPTLNTYNDITHISNNSIIPCNMKIQNSGYNAIIKPSTLYTVALDTNKSGTIGINLGGAKVTTTNNVATITTPATLADDSLRLYGKGIKGSKVRLLEGDKTNWIPSFFEGMQSSFEDKLQDDGTFKMEILMNNRNLFDINGRTTTSNDVSVEKNNNTLVISNENKQATWQQHNIFIKGLQHNKTYLVTMEDLIVQNNFEQMDMYAISVYEETRNLHLSSVFDVNKKQIRFSVPLGAKLDRISLRIHLNSTSAIVNKITIKNIQISEVYKNIIDRKYNKIQFSSIEPLRKWDRFVFKDGKLMIERNTVFAKFNGSEGWNDNSGFTNNGDYFTGYIVDNKMEEPTSDLNNAICKDFYVNTHYNTIQGNQEGFNCAKNKHFYLRVHKNRLTTKNIEGFRNYLSNNNLELIYQKTIPTYEEVPFELAKIILEGYENGTLFFDTNIPPTVTTTYSGETPIVKSVRLNKTEVLNNTNDINDNIVPYLMDMDYRVVCLQLEGGIENVSMARLFGGTFEMLQRDILSNRYSKEEYKYRLDAYLSANKITDDEYTKLGEMLND